MSRRANSVLAQHRREEKELLRRLYQEARQPDWHPEGEYRDPDEETVR